MYDSIDLSAWLTQSHNLRLSETVELSPEDDHDCETGIGHAGPLSKV